MGPDTPAPVADDPDADIDLEGTLASEVLAGDSQEQREAEAVILAGLAERLGVALGPARFLLASGGWVSVDGHAAAPPVLVEVWSHQGPPKPAQKAKVITDALKLLWLDRHLFDGKARKILALADPAAAAHFLSARTWIAQALRDLQIEVAVVGLSDALRARVRTAQERQRR